jgi:hypothetical protein
VAGTAAVVALVGWLYFRKLTGSRRSA